MASGTLLVLASAILFGVNPSLQSLVLRDGISPAALVGLSYTVISLLAFAACTIQQKPLCIRRSQAVQLCLMGTLGMGGTSFLLNSAYRFLPVGVVTMLHFLFPSVVCGAMSLFFRQRLTARRLAAILSSAAGLVLMNTAGSGFSLPGTLLALSSAATYAAYIILNERGPACGLPQMVKLLYIAASAALPYTLFALLTRAVFPTSAGALVRVLLIGVLYSFSIGFFNAGIQKIGAARAAFLSTLEPITSVAVSSLLFSYRLPAVTFWGCLLIIGAMLFIAGE